MLSGMLLSYPHICDISNMIILIVHYAKTHQKNKNNENQENTQHNKENTKWLI